jgi:hypothetical protein
MIKRYRSFSEDFLLESILKESVLYFSPKIKSMLKNINSDIASSLLDIEMTDIKPDVSFVDIDNKDGYFSFNTMRNATNILNNKDYEHLLFIKDVPGERSDDKARRERLIKDIYNHNTLSDIFKKSINPVRIGKFINKVLPGKFNSSQIEEFVNLFKSQLEKLGERFELVEGDDIATWYKSENYAEVKGTLGNSCMANKRSDVFKLYTSNKEVCRMLVLFENNQVIGRALVWKLSEIKAYGRQLPDNLYFMDRQYTIKESDVPKFRKYAKDNGWVYKTNNNHHSLEMVTYEEDDFRATLSVQVETEPDKFPYMDTFRRFNPVDKLLHNDEEDSSDYEGDYILDHTDGTYRLIEGGVWSEWLGRMIPEYSAVWSDYADSHLDRNSAIYVDEGSRRYHGWYPEGCDDLVYDEYSDMTIHIDDSVYSEAYGHSIYEGSAVEVIRRIDSDGEPMGADSNWYHKDDDDILYIGDVSKLTWFKRLSNSWGRWDDYSYALASLFTENYKGDKIIERFAITTYKVVDSEEDSIDIKNITEYLTDIDSDLLGYSIDKNDSRVVDKFEYYDEIEELLTQINSKANSEYNKVEQELLGGGQLRLVFDEEDKANHKDMLENKLNRLKEKISDIDNGYFVDKLD